jgi:hypothetical protein
MLNQIIASIRSQNPLGPLHGFVSAINIPQDQFFLCQLNGIQINCKFTTEGLAQLRQILANTSLFNLVGRAIQTEASIFDLSSRCLILNNITLLSETWDLSKALPHWSNVESNETVAAVLHYCKLKPCLDLQLPLISFQDLLMESSSPRKKAARTAQPLSSPAKTQVLASLLSDHSMLFKDLTSLY